MTLRYLQPANCLNTAPPASLAGPEIGADKHSGDLGNEEENEIPTNNLAHELKLAAHKDAAEPLNSSHSQERADKMDSFELSHNEPLLKNAAVDEHSPTDVEDISYKSIVATSPIFEDFGSSIGDTSFMHDSGSQDDFDDSSLESTRSDFLSELLFDEEDSGTNIFDPDMLGDNAFQCSPISDGAETMSGPTSVVPEDVHPPVPVSYDFVYEHSFQSQTLLRRRLKYLRQMHILMELGRDELFTDAKPLVVPVLHRSRPSRGLGWSPEKGIVGDRSPAHRSASPTIIASPMYLELCAEERAVANEACTRRL
ncbi:hypothetical protein PYCCODRAFT_1439842 [Trametes coccinea BRFM310]|uniref:Uncharacterized protein n=1 Tax=Trametes coccinea (strain BRFM310) TaxID=1353009 RepID=A0A1Y2I9W0_TRAC3|nr:hypothetical protein PYCCODRAFT_1439842 [Trametes coccinea BRFM310]